MGKMWNQIMPYTLIDPFCLNRNATHQSRAQTTTKEEKECGSFSFLAPSNSKEAKMNGWA